MEIESLTLPLPSLMLSVADFRVEAGNKVALVGRNGAGKTSLLEVMLGLRSGGELRGSLLGQDVERWHKDASLRARVGVQLQKAALPGWLQVSEIVAFHRSLYGRAGEDVAEALGVEPLRRKRYEWLSRGESQRVDLFLALAHRPELLFLDEPLTGLDPQFARSCMQLLEGMRDSTILMCCHTSEELRLASHVAWIADGRIAHYAARDALRLQLVGDHRLSFQCESDAVARALAASLASAHPQARLASVCEGRAILFGGDDLNAAARELVAHGDVESVEFGRSTLVDLLQHCARNT
ncbi:hypothetical protein ASF44_30335 [Pseudorhodoferax sp. Leaf274]|nr:hypothetical protein ASF44_30335 [Pseudorhodoferax sp. Leaf274]